jgi:serine protein kinase
MENEKNEKDTQQQKTDDLASLVKKDKTSPSSFRKLNWEGSFWDYLKLVEENPRLVRNAYQRLYDMVLSHGSETFEYCKRKYIKYNFFKTVGDVSIFGLEESIMEFVDILKSASRHYGPERRVVLLHGPVGSSKSTIVSTLKAGLEDYSATDEGALYSFSWKTTDRDGNEK